MKSSVLLLLIFFCYNLFSADKFYIITDNHIKILDNFKTYHLKLINYDDILVKGRGNIGVELIFPKKQCNFNFLNKIWFENEDSSKNRFFVENYYVDYYDNESLNKVCRAYYRLQGYAHLYKLFYTTDEISEITIRLFKE